MGPPLAVQSKLIFENRANLCVIGVAVILPTGDTEIERERKRKRERERERESNINELFRKCNRFLQDCLLHVRVVIYNYNNLIM